MEIKNGIIIDGVLQRYNIKLTVKDVHCYLCVISLMLFVPLLVAKHLLSVAK